MKVQTKQTSEKKGLKRKNSTKATGIEKNKKKNKKVFKSKFSEEIKIQKSETTNLQIDKDVTANSETIGAQVPSTRNSEDPIQKKVKWTNRTRVLIFCSRGISFRNRHLMKDLQLLLPHSKTDSKKDRKANLQAINEIAEMKNCNKTVYFECKNHDDLFMWLSDISKGPCMKFLVENVHSMKELKLTGNSLKGTRPLLTFDTNFETSRHYALMKELITQIFASPSGHPKTQPFFDHVFTFSVVDNKIWFRNYQIVEEDGQLTEIGPRFVLNPVKIIEGSFGGKTLWSNPKYETPAKFRQNRREERSMKYYGKKLQADSKKEREITEPFVGDPTNDFFATEVAEEKNERKKGKKGGKKPGKKQGKKGKNKGKVKVDESY